MSKLTRKLLDETFDAIRNAPPHPCSLGKHVISSTALRDGWEYAICGNCMQPVKLRERSSTDRDLQDGLVVPESSEQPKPVPK